MLQTIVQKTMVEWNMVKAKETLLVGVSGGADSVCLLLSLMDLREPMDFSLEAIHVEHGIRGEESLQDEQFVVKLCGMLEIPLTQVTVDAPAYSKEKGIGLEEAARELRYQAFSKVAKEKKARVALAHHMEDNAETILFQLVRGSSLTGLCGMQPVRTDESGVEYIRPMLYVHRAEIEEELKIRGQDYCTDSTNVELEYSRNYLRNIVLPQLQQVNEQAVAHMNGAAVRLQEVKDFLEQETQKAWLAVQKDDSKQSDKMQDSLQELDVLALSKLHPALQKEVVLKAITKAAGSRKDIMAVHVEEVLQLCQKQSGKAVNLPYRVVAKRDFDTIRICKEEEALAEASLEVPKTEVSEAELTRLLALEEGLQIVLGNGKEILHIRAFSYDAATMEIPKKTYTKWFDYDKIKKGFCIRTRRSGDYFISDALGHHKKLKTYFVDEKISTKEREQMWLLAQDSVVLWLIGGRISEHIKVTKDTKTIVEIEYDGGNEHGFYKEA